MNKNDNDCPRCALGDGSHQNLETHSQLKARLHKALFGDCFGYDLEHASTVTPAVQAIKHLKEGRTIPETAKLVDVSEQQVREWLAEAGLKKTTCYVETRPHRANTYTA